MECLNHPKTRVYDTVVIGAGAGGVYTCFELEKKGYKGEICIIEKEHFAGGRLFSEETWESTRDSVKDELGGMRIFPSVHKEVYQMAKDAQLDVIAIPLNDANSLFDFRGKTYRKRNVRFPGTGKFANEKISSIKKAAKAKFKKIHGDFEDAYQSPQLQNMSLREFFKRYGGANDEEVDFWFAYSGYNLYQDNIQVSISVAAGALYGSDITHHHFIKQGYSALLNDIRETLHCRRRFNMKVERIHKRDADGMYILWCDENRKVLAKNVIFSITKYQLLAIQGITSCLSPQRLAAIDCCIPMPLFKAFMEFNDPWWAKAGFAGQGKTTTDRKVRQIHYYDESDLLIYNSGEYAIYWGKIFEADPMKGYRMIFEQIKEIHQPYCTFEIPEPDWEQCSHMFWCDGSHKWKKGCDVRECIETIADGSKDGLYITGDAFSDQQGWVQGAFDTTKVLMEHFLEAESQNVCEKSGKHGAVEIGSYEQRDEGKNSERRVTELSSYAYGNEAKNSDNVEIAVMDVDEKIEIETESAFPCICCCRGDPSSRSY